MANVSRRQEAFCLIFYAVLLLITLSTIAATYTNFPLFPFQIDSLSWSNAWLIAYLINYYGVILCFCGIVVASEASWRAAILWIIGLVVIGSPACCLYVFLWLTKEGGTLRLERESAILPVVQQQQQQRQLRQVSRHHSPHHQCSSSYTPSKPTVCELKDDAATAETPSSSAGDSTTSSPPSSPPRQQKQQQSRLKHQTRYNNNLHHQIHHHSTTRHHHHIHLPHRGDVERGIS